MFNTQRLLIILILSHLATIVFVIFDVQKVFPIFLLRFRNNEGDTSSEKLLSSREQFQKEDTRLKNLTTKGSKSSFQQLGIEERWRHVLSTIRNMWLFLHHRFFLLKEMKLPDRAKRIINYLDESGVEYYRVLWFEISQLLSLQEWRDSKRQLAAALGETVQKRIDKLQNPADCKKAKVFLCKLTNPYGFASSFHDVLWCFVKAYHGSALLLLDVSKWHYEIGRWNSVFLPLSRNCINEELSYLKDVSLPGPNNARSRFELTLLPEDLGPSIIRAVDQPFVWWYGQFMKYIMRPNHNFTTYLASKKQEVGFVHPIVGIHVRRTDKIGNEAKYHDLEEYMYYVEDYYLRMELHGDKQDRRVFIASDDPKVLQECKERFQRYTCLGFPDNAALAYNFHKRDIRNSLWGVLVELTLLSECEFLVCTFSSGFCRIAYELMHAVDPEASNRVHSLDVEYAYAFQNPPDRVVLYGHTPKIPEELELRRDDILRKKDEFAIGYEATKGKNMDGLAEGVNPATGKIGRYPTFKTAEYFHFKNPGSRVEEQER